MSQYCYFHQRYSVDVITMIYQSYPSLIFFTSVPSFYSLSPFPAHCLTAITALTVTEPPGQKISLIVSLCCTPRAMSPNCALIVLATVVEGKYTGYSWVGPRQCRHTCCCVGSCSCYWCFCGRCSWLGCPCSCCCCGV